MKKSYQILTMIVLIALVMFNGSVFAQEGDNPEEPKAVLGSGFTYQGYLTDSSGSPVDDSCNMIFALWSAAPSGGIQLGSDETKTGVQVANGKFTVTLNDTALFGPNAFDGNERFLSVSISCQGGAGAQFPRQKLNSTPYALYALNVADHNHITDTWVQSAGSQPLLTLEKTATSTGYVMVIDSSLSGLGLDVTGNIHSSEDSKQYLSPFTAMERNPADDLTFTLRSHGGVSIASTVNTTGERLVVIPVSTFGLLLGSAVYVKGLQVCYKADTTGPQFIDGVGVYKGNGTDYAAYLSDGINRSATTRSCFTVNAATRLMIDNSSYVQLHLNWDNTHTASDSITIYSVMLILSEEQS